MTSDQIADIGGFPERRYWYEALVHEVLAVWGDHPIYKASVHIEELAYYAFLTSFFENHRADIRNRRRALYYFLAGPFATDRADDPLNIHAHKLPVDSFIPKVVTNLAIAYADPPDRSWSINGQPADDIQVGILKAIYVEAGADGRLKHAHEYAELCSGSLVGPYIDSRKRWRFQILTPDLFRAENDGDILTKLTIATERDGVTVFENWTPEIYFETDANGARLLIQDTDPQTGQPIAVIERVNRYGRVPYEALRLVEPTTSCLLSGGLFPTVEACVACNMLRFAEDQSSLMESWGQWVAINLGIAEKAGIRFGPGRVIAMDNVEGGQDAVPPSLDHVSPSASYTTLHDLIQKRAEDAMRTVGLPQSLVSSIGSTPPSGIARYLERLELIERRNSSINALADFERRLSDLIITVHNADIARPNGAQELNPELTLSIDYAEERVIDDPDKLFISNTRALLTGTMSASRYVREEMGIDRPMSNEDAINLIAENQALVARVAAILGPAAGIVGAPSAPTQTVALQSKPLDNANPIQ
jgi:hypothetical protein